MGTSYEFPRRKMLNRRLNSKAIDFHLLKGSDLMQLSFDRLINWT